LALHSLYWPTGLLFKYSFQCRLYVRACFCTTGLILCLLFFLHVNYNDLQQLFVTRHQHARIRNSAALYVRYSLLWVLCRCPETSLNNYQPMLRKKAEERRRQTAAGFNTILAPYNFSKIRVNGVINLLYMYNICASCHFCCYVPEKDYTGYIKNCIILLRRLYLKYLI
jgi:hypothetical protein